MLGSLPRAIPLRPVVGVGLACLLAACASLQRHDRSLSSLPTPSGWTAIEPATLQVEPASLAHWWRRFDDPLLERLVERALVAATDVQAAQARLRQARAQYEASAAVLRPSVGGHASAQVSDSERASPARLYRAGFDAAWEVDLWGGTRAGIAAADAEARAGAASLGQTRVSLAAEVAAAYFDLRGLQARRATQRANLANLERTLRLVAWREEAGLVTRLDTEQQRSAVEQARAALPVLETAIAQAMNLLAVLAGEVPGTLHAELAPAADLPRAPAPVAPAVPEAVLAQRADVAAAEARVRAAEARVEQADAERLPSLALSGTIGLNALSLSALSSGAGVATMLAAVNLPVHDTGRIAAGVRGREAALDEARAGHRAATLLALREVEDALTALRGNAAQLDSQRAAAAAAGHAAGLAEQRYAAGLIDFASVLQTQRARLATQDAVNTTVASLLTQHVRLYKALGGGWDAGADAQVEQGSPASPRTRSSAWTGQP